MEPGKNNPLKEERNVTDPGLSPQYAQVNDEDNLDTRNVAHNIEEGDEDYDDEGELEESDFDIDDDDDDDDEDEVL